MQSGIKDAVAASTKKIVDATSAYFRMSGVPTFAHDPVPPQLIKAVLPAEHLAPGEHTAMAAHRFVDLFENSVKPMLREQVSKHLGRGSAFDTHRAMLQNKDERDAGEPNLSIVRNVTGERVDGTGVVNSLTARRPFGIETSRDDLMYDLTGHPQRQLLAQRVIPGENGQAKGAVGNEPQVLPVRHDSDPHKRDEPRRDYSPLGSDSQSENLTSGKQLKPSETEDRLNDYNNGEFAETVDQAIAASDWRERMMGRAGMKVQGKGRYIWTKYGWVDLQHVISAATATPIPEWNVGLGVLTEVAQGFWPKYWSSAYKEEDLLSNWIGAKALERQKRVGGTIGEAVAHVLSRYKPVSKKEATEYLRTRHKGRSWLLSVAKQAVEDIF
ncbi:MAG: hypothetical protein K8S25_02095 [Alphaproteobacteria bacterium]|nr:hypothetical protein [Alphaproteobacteria bacterium]